MNRIYDAFLTARGVGEYHFFLKNSQFATPLQIKVKQAEWLECLLVHAHKNIPWYSTKFRQYGVRVTGSDPFFELAKLPLLSKSEVRENHSDFCLPAVAEKSLSFATSGTTGEPLTAYTSKNQWIIEQGIIWRQRKWAGYKFRDRIAIFRSYAPSIGEPKIKVDRLRNWSYFSVFSMGNAALDEYFAYLNHWKPHFLRGYPSALLLVAEHAIRKGWRLPGLKAAFSASEVVPTILREKLREAFGIELFDHYGQAEISCMFHDCERHNGMHLDWEYGYVELLPTEKLGVNKIVATNLHNLSMPLLRYDTGDLVDGNWQACTCGRGSKIVQAIHGRSDNYLFVADGSRISTVNLYTYFSKINDIKRFQIVQEQHGELKIYLSFWDADSNNRFESIKNKVAIYLKDMTGLRILMPINFDFIQTGEGKLPTFIQRIKNDH